MKKFITTFIISFLVFALLEYLLHILFNIDLENLDWGWLGWLGFIIAYGFKFHIICCILPLIFTSYSCRHKCNHEHCIDVKDKL